MNTTTNFSTTDQQTTQQQPSVFPKRAKMIFMGFAAVTIAAITMLI